MDSHMMRHNIGVFRDTCRCCREDSDIRGFVEMGLSGQRVIPEEQVLEFTKVRPYRTEVTVSGLKSFQAARGYAGERVAVLNFANWYEPGGSVAFGSNSQEEALCRCSTLYPCISSEEAAGGFYGPHNKNSSDLANDDIIYTPHVCVFKDDDYPNDPFPAGERFEVDVITCSAPMVRYTRISDVDLYDLQIRRIDRILEVAYCSGCTHLILGAFGCGAFANDPKVVASAFEQVLSDWMGCFKRIEFAVFATETESKNYLAFRVLDGLEGRSHI